MACPDRPRRRVDREISAVPLAVASEGNPVSGQSQQVVQPPKTLGRNWGSAGFCLMLELEMIV